MNSMTRLAHALLAASDHNLSVTEPNCLRPERDRAKAGTANLINAVRCNFHWYTGCHCSLAGWILACACCQNLSQYDFGDFLGLYVAPLKNLLYYQRPQTMCGKTAKSAIQFADRRPRCARDDNFAHVVI
jgi:hypothetical protein